MPSKPSHVGNRTTRRAQWDHGGKSRIERGYDHRWMKLRVVVLARDQHLCQPCRRAGRVTPATAVDHITPKAKGGTDALDNLEATCDPCHLDKSIRDQGKRPRRAIDVTGWPVE